MHEIGNHDEVMYELRTQTAMLILIIVVNLILLFIAGMLVFSQPKDPLDCESCSAIIDASTGTPNTGGTINAEASAGQI